MSFKKLKDATSDLNLSYEEQDWGIINSDSSRVLEFIDYFNSNKKSKSSSFKYSMIELIISSFNDAIIENKINQKVENSFKDFIFHHKNKELYETIFNYWVSIKDDPEFPVGKYF